MNISIHDISSKKDHMLDKKFINFLMRVSEAH